MANAVNFRGCWGDVVAGMSENHGRSATFMSDTLPHLGDAMWPAAIIMHDMGLSGRQIWFAFNDFAGRSFHKLVKALEERSPELVDFVNQRSREEGLEPSAVQRGKASQWLVRLLDDN